MSKTKMPRSVQDNTDLNTPTYKKPPKDDRHRLFCFTHFDDHHNIFNLIGTWRYIVAGREICPKTKSPHYQCMVYFDQKFSLSNIKKKLLQHLGKQPHTEVVFMDFATKFRYCTKDNDFYEWGNKPSQGARHDLNSLRDDIFNGKTVESIRFEDPLTYHQYGRTLDKLEDDYNRKKIRQHTTTCEWIYGETGCGKSHYAFKDFNPDTHFVYTEDKDWWDGYKGQKIVILDDYRGSIPFNILIRMADCHPNLKVSRRAREPINFTSRHIIITSCAKPDEVYYNKLSINDNIKQLYRRCEIKKFVKISDNF